MNQISESELERQFRVITQLITMHSVLRERYSRRALFLDVILLICSVVFCSTTFASNDLFIFLNLEPNKVRTILGVASVLAFIAAIISLRVDWKGKSTKHKDAVNKLCDALELFRENKNKDGKFENEKTGMLSQAYWITMKNIVEIPEKHFITLKGKHLRKVQISKLSDDLNGCPIWAIKFLVIWNSLKKAFNKNIYEKTH